MMMLVIAAQGRAAIEVLFTGDILPHPHTPSPANGHFPHRRKGNFSTPKGHLSDAERAILHSRKGDR